MDPADVVYMGFATFLYPTNSVQIGVWVYLKLKGLSDLFYSKFSLFSLYRITLQILPFMPYLVDCDFLDSMLKVKGFGCLWRS